MSLIKLSLKHGQTIEQAQQSLEQAVTNVNHQFAMLIDRVNWDDQRRNVDIQGKGFDVQMRLDQQDVHVEANIPIIGKLLGNRLVEGVKRVIENTFQKTAQIEHSASSEKR